MSFQILNDGEVLAVGHECPNDGWGFVDTSKPYILAVEHAAKFCCGISEWGEFESRNDSNIPEKKVVEFVKAMMDYSRDENSGIIRMQFHQPNAEGAWENKRLMDAVVAHEGFELINDFINPNTNNRVREYQCSLVDNDD